MKIHSATIIPSNDHKLFIDQLYVKNHVRYYRIKRGFSQQSLANWSGVSRETISRIENNEHIPNIKTILIISNLVNRSVEDLFELY